MSGSDSVQASDSVATIRGRNVVFAMFAFGCIATTTMWVYWNLHMMPFMPLQEALVSEFGKDSAPRVEGGQRKIHKNSTKMLRVILKVPFNPESDDSLTRDKINDHMTRVRDTADEIIDLSDYETLEMHLFHDKQEDRFPQVTVRKNIDSWVDVNEDGTPVEPEAT